jgi:hypothetical protein
MKSYEIFIEMKKLPKGYIIDNPHGLIETDFKISKEILPVLKTESDLVSFTRLSKKNLSEKTLECEYLFIKLRHNTHFEGLENAYFRSFFVSQITCL